MNATALEAVAEELAVTIGDIQASRYLSAAGISVMIYDHSITFSDEVQLIWRAPLSLVSALFLINRYVVPSIMAVDLFESAGFARNISLAFCRNWIVIESNLQVLTFTIAHALVAIRVCVLWNTHPWVKTMLIGLGTAYLVVTLAIANFVNANVLPTVYWQPIVNICYGQLPRWAAWTFVPSIPFECLLFGLTVASAIQHRRRDISVTEGVIGVLYRDGILYFIVMAGCSVFNIIVWAALRPSLVVLAKFFTFCFVNVMASRIVLNLRAQRRDSPDDRMIHFTSASSSSGGILGFTFAGRLRAARRSTATRDPLKERHDVTLPGEQIALRCLNLGDMSSSNRRDDAEHPRQHAGGELGDAPNDFDGKEDQDLESRGQTPPVLTDTEAEADHEEYERKSAFSSV